MGRASGGSRNTYVPRLSSVALMLMFPSDLRRLAAAASACCEVSVGTLVPSCISVHCYYFALYICYRFTS